MSSQPQWSLDREVRDTGFTNTMTHVDGSVVIQTADFSGTEDLILVNASTIAKTPDGREVYNVDYATEEYNEDEASQCLDAWAKSQRPLALMALRSAQPTR